MTETNHALAGALIGLAISEPLVAAPLAFASHFVLDAVPHYGSRLPDKILLKTKRFKVYLLADASACILLVLILALARPRNWLLAAICAFVATVPDLFWLKKFISINKTGKDILSRNWFMRLHAIVQWSARPSGLAVEAAFLIGALIVLAPLV